MKKRIQKYLSGSNEGFSLVELIIVIAIMAILVGVVALAVIPYLEKSKESKDLQTLDTIASAFSTAIADVQAGGNVQVSITVDDSGAVKYEAATKDDKTSEKVATAMQEALGSQDPSLNCTNAVEGDGKGKVITCKYTNSNNELKTFAGANETSIPKCKYNNGVELSVTNTSKTTKTEG